MDYYAEDFSRAELINAIALEVQRPDLALSAKLGGRDFAIARVLERVEERDRAHALVMLASVGRAALEVLPDDEHRQRAAELIAAARETAVTSGDVAALEARLIDVMTAHEGADDGRDPVALTIAAHVAETSCGQGTAASACRSLLRVAAEAIDDAACADLIGSAHRAIDRHA